jgi:hypothetical protein
MALIQCKECTKEVSDLAASCPHCGAPVEKPKAKSGAGSAVMLLAFMGLVAFFALPSILSNTSTSVFKHNQFEIRVGGHSGIQFSGAYMLVDRSGKSVSKTIDGLTPKVIKVNGSIVSCSFQKMVEHGSLRVEILKNGQMDANSETSAAYGVVTAATH